MVLYSMVAVTTIILACQIRTSAYTDRMLSRQRVLNGTAMAAIFCILTALAALRIEVGNDYGTYVVTCHEIFQHGYVITEPGYNFVVRILYTLSGREDYILMFAVFGVAIVAVFLAAMKKQSDDFTLTFFLFMTMGIYYMSFNTVRYYFALAITLYSLRYIIGIQDKTVGEYITVRGVVINWQNLIKFIVLILLAATFHKSVLVVIPMYLIARFPWNTKVIVLLLILGVAGLIFSDRLLEVLLILYPSYKDTVYATESKAIIDNAPVIGRCLLVLILGIVCYKDAIKESVANKTYFNMNIMAIILYLTCWWMPLVTRFGYYLITSHILFVPGIISLLQDEKKKRIKALVIIFGIVYFVYFLFTASRDGVRVLPYKSWLFYDKYWLNQTDTF